MTDKKPSEKPLPTPDPERTEEVREAVAEYARDQRAIFGRSASSIDAVLAGARRLKLSWGAEEIKF